MKKVVLGLLMLVFTAVAVQAQTDSMSAVEGAADLEKVKRSKFRETYVNTSADFTQYNKLYLGDAHFDYRDVGESPRYRSSMRSVSSKSVFGIADTEREKFEQYVDEAFTKELSKSKTFKIVDTLDEQTIIVRGAVVDIVSRVPPEFVGRSEVYLASVGEATLVMEFLDGKTGEVLARVAERRTIGRGQIDMMTMPSNSVTVWADVRRWASSAAKRLRSELDLAMEG